MQQRTDPEGGDHCARERDGIGREGPGAPQHRGLHVPAPHAHDGVVVARDDRAIVHDEAVRDAREALERLAGLDADGLVAGVAARHHERPVDRPHEQVVQRRGRKHRALAAVPRSHGRREPLAIGHEHDGSPP